jgi:hypothetical protein
VVQGWCGGGAGSVREVQAVYRALDRVYVGRLRVVGCGSCQTSVLLEVSGAAVAMVEEGLCSMKGGLVQAWRQACC